MTWWGELNTPGDFRRDWYGELTNQMGHTLLGVLVTSTFCDVWYLCFGEMPVRAWVFMLVFLPYAVGIEAAVQKWVSGDSWFDSAMFALGAAGVLLPYREMSEVGSPLMLSYSPEYRLTIQAAWALILFLRVKRRYDANKRHG